MIEKDDWRLEASPAAHRLHEYKGITLYKISFQPLSEERDHEHCAFCWEKFYLGEDGLKEGYCTAPQNEPGAKWICPVCYSDFKDMFNWSEK